MKFQNKKLLLLRLKPYSQVFFKKCVESTGFRKKIQNP